MLSVTVRYGPLLCQVRYSVLAPRSLITYHDDGFAPSPSGHWLDKTARIHLVVDSPEGAYTVIGPTKQVWSNGDVQLGHYGFPHYVYNPHPTRNRTHLVVDAYVGDHRAPRKRLVRLFGEGVTSRRSVVDPHVKAKVLRALYDFQCSFSSSREEYEFQLEEARRALVGVGRAGGGTQTAVYV